MPEHRAIVSVFLASPGGVDAERTAVRSALDRINRKHARQLGLSLELLRWEDAPAAVGRPQSQINPLVAACDLFLGVLGSRWGSPPGSASHTSGFEEEFSQALERNRRTGSPQIALFLRRITTEERNDPGPQLKAVLAFRESLIAERALLFCEYEDVSDFAEQAYDRLLTAGFDARVQVSEDVSSSPRPPIIPGEAGGDDARPLAALRERVLTALNVDDDHPDSSAEAGIDSACRAALAVDAHLYRQFGNIELSVHVTNRLHLRRECLKPTGTELQLLLASCVAGQYSPGWFWLHDVSREEALLRLLHLTDESRPLAVRSGALTLMAEASLRPDDSTWDIWRFLQHLAPSPLSPLEDEAFAYIRAVGRAEDLEASSFASESSDGIWRGLVGLAVLRAGLTARIAPDTFLEQIRDQIWLDQRLEDVLPEALRQASTQALHGALRCQINDFRAAVAEELFTRGDIDRQTAESLRVDSAAAVREVALRWLIANTSNITSADILSAFATTKDEPPNLINMECTERLLSQYYGTIEPERLEGELDWLRPASARAYRALLLKTPDTAAQRIELDLRTSYAHVKQAYLQRLSSQLGVSTADLSAGFSIDGADVYMLPLYRSAALDVIGELKLTAFRATVRELAADSDFRVKASAQSALARLAGAQDVPLLVEAARSAPSLQCEELLEAALGASVDQARLVHALLHGPDTSLVLGLLRICKRSPEVIADEFLRPLVRNESETIRREALHQLIKRWDRAKLEMLLAEEQASETYYYDVVAVLDGLLLGPEWLRPVFEHRASAQ